MALQRPKMAVGRPKVAVGCQIVAKASDGQQYPMPLSKCWFEFEGERGSGPEGVADAHIC